MIVKCFAQEHTTLTRPDLEPRPLDLQNSKFSALPFRPQRLPYLQNVYHSMITNLITSDPTNLQMETSEGILLKGKFSYQGMSGNTP